MRIKSPLHLKLLKKLGRIKPKKLDSIVGIVSGGPKDLSKNMDHYLYGVQKPKKGRKKRI